ncbi:1,4-beta-xylanase [Calothrix sp. HK-06]|nr:1,4-beta-xylanase [Calothrix sp. HK-06]
MWKRFLLMFCCSLVIFLCQAIYSNMAMSPLQLKTISTIDSNIRALRTGELKVNVVDAQNNPIVGATVKLEQVRHNFEFGTVLNTEIFTNKFSQQDKDRYLAIAKQYFNASVHENALKWYSTEPQRGRVSYAPADTILNWSLSTKLKMRGHTLFWEDEKYNQPWLKSLGRDELKRAVIGRAQEVCSRYRGRIDEFDVLNEMLHGNFFRSRLGNGIVKEMFDTCKRANPNAVLYVNDFNILNGRELDKYVQLIHSLLKQGVPIGGIGAQGHIRDKITPERIQKSLDTLAQFKLPIKITEFDAVSDTEEDKAQILRNVYQVAFAHPAVQGILMWGFWESTHWKPKAALYNRNWQPLLAAQAYIDLVYDKWWTRVNTVTNDFGRVCIRGFFGDYRLLVSVRNQKNEQTFSFKPSNNNSKIIDVVIR